MSGAEVILGVIPLLIEVADYSHTVYQQFKRWRKYDSELEKFQAELYCYQCIFQTDCELLIGSVTTTAEFDLIMERNVTGLENPDLERKLMNYLGGQYSCCGMLMERIKKDLDDLHAKSQQFQDALTVSDSTAKEHIEKRGWRSRRAKAVFSVTGPALSARLATLRKYIETLHLILEQTRTPSQGRNGSMPNKVENHSIPAPNNSTLPEITSVQTAANTLYNSLLISCTDHNEYAVYLRLKMQHGDVSGVSKVKFDLRLQPASKDDSKSSPFSPQKPLGELPNLGKRPRQSFSEFSGTKRVKINDSENRVPQSPSSLRNHMMELSLSDDTPQENVPHEISTASPSPRYSSNKWNGEQTRIGAQHSHPTEHEVNFELAKAVKDLGHQVILDAASFRQPPPTSLADHISNWPPINYNHPYLPHEILFLAKHIASAVLHFHATPLLQEQWTNHCFALLDMGDKSTNKRRPLADPHLKVPIPSQLNQDTEFESVTSRPRAMIRNPYTFTFGILLIELAHQRPWQALKDENLPDEDDDFVTKFDLVDRLAARMITLYGLPYKKIVRKCINCDFGEGEYDLRNSKLRLAFYRDVICVLEKMEQDFAELQRER